MEQTAKIFLNGSSQAVRLPKEFRFDEQKVYIRRNEMTGEVILSSKPRTWQGLIQAYEALSEQEKSELDGFLSPADRQEHVSNTQVMARENLFSELDSEC